MWRLRWREEEKGMEKEMLRGGGGEYKGDREREDGVRERDGGQITQLTRRALAGK